MEKANPIRTITTIRTIRTIRSIYWIIKHLFLVIVSTGFILAQSSTSTSPSTSAPPSSPSPSPSQHRSDVHFLEFSIQVGVDPTDGSKQKSLGILYVRHHASLLATYQNRDLWILASRAYFGQHWFFQQSIQKNRIDQSDSTGIKAPTYLHPYILRPAIGYEYTINHLRDLQIRATLGESLRLKTASSGYAATLSFEMKLPRESWTGQLQVNRSPVARTTPWEIRLGIAKRIDFGK